MSMDARTGRSRPSMKDKIRGAYMYAPNQAQSRMRPAFRRTTGTAKKTLRNVKTSDIRAFLSELKMLPHSHRKLLCKLLRRAAAHAPGKASVVRLADARQKMQL